LSSQIEKLLVYDLTNDETLFFYYIISDLFALFTLFGNVKKPVLRRSFGSLSESASIRESRRVAVILKSLRKLRAKLVGTLIVDGLSVNN